MKGEFAIRCFIDNVRISTSALTKEEALNFRKAAKHLVWYLSATYRLDRKEGGTDETS